MRVDVSTGAVFRVSLYYGVAGFGGGYSVLAQLRRDLVERRKWLSADDFLVLAELSKSLPGTPATNLLALLGQRVDGTRGGLVAAGAFLLPSTVLMTACAAAYSLVRAATGLSLFFDGMNAAMVGVVGAVTVDLGRYALRSGRDLVMALLSGLLLATRLVSEPILAGAAAAIGATLGALSAEPSRSSLPSIESVRPPPSDRLHGVLPFVAIPLVVTGSFALLAGLVRVFLPIGVMTFGGGLAMIPAIDHMVVIRAGLARSEGLRRCDCAGSDHPWPRRHLRNVHRIPGCWRSRRTGRHVGHVRARDRGCACGGPLDRSLPSRVPSSRACSVRSRPPSSECWAQQRFSLGRAAIGVPIDAAIGVLAFVVLVWRPVSPMWLLVGGGLARLALHGSLAM